MIRTWLARLRHPLFAMSALLLLVILGEVGLRIFDSYTGQITREEIYDQGMLRKSWVTHHALKPSETYRRTISDSEPPVEIRINSLGVRHQEAAIPKPPGVYRILCLGDARTLGAEVPQEETFAAQLEDILRNSTRQRVEVINAGVPGYCPLLCYLQVKHQLAVLQPDLLVLNFDMTDVADDYQYRRLTSMSPQGLPLVCTNPKLLPSPESGASRDCELLLLLRWGKQTATGMWAENTVAQGFSGIGSTEGRYAWLQDQPPDWSVYILQSLEPISQLKQLARGLYCDLLVAAGPAPWQVSATASCGGNLREEIGVPAGTLCRSRVPFELLARHCREHHLSFCDTSPAFVNAETPDTLFQHNTVGYSRSGHRLYARELARRVVRNSAGIWDSPSTPPERRETTSMRDAHLGNQ